MTIEAGVSSVGLAAVAYTIVVDRIEVRAAVSSRSSSRVIEIWRVVKFVVVFGGCLLYGGGF